MLNHFVMLAFHLEKNSTYTAPSTPTVCNKQIQPELDVIHNSTITNKQQHMLNTLGGGVRNKDPIQIYTKGAVRNFKEKKTTKNTKKQNKTKNNNNTNTNYNQGRTGKRQTNKKKRNEGSGENWKVLNRCFEGSHFIAEATISGFIGIGTCTLYAI